MSRGGEMGPLGAPREIAVFRALQLGDLLCAIPALRALRAALPRSRVTLIGLPWAADLAARFVRYVDDFIPFPGFPGLRERACDAREVTRFLSEAQRRRFDLALQLHGSGERSNVLAALLGARRCAGFFRAGDHCPDPERFLVWRDDEHEIVRWLRLLRALDVPASDPTLEFPLDERDRADLERALDGRRLEPRAYVCVHAGSQLRSRRWHPERFAAVADALAADGFAIVLTGTASEASLTRRVAAAMRAPALDLAGRTTLGAAGELIRGARLLVANDTGVAHVAAALGTPSVRICCGADPRRFAPLDTARHRVLHAQVDCRPCVHDACPLGHPCAAGVPAAAVIAAAREQLERRPARAVDDVAHAG